MELFSEALAISGMSIVMVFAVLVLLMLFMYLSAAFFDRAGRKAAQEIDNTPPPVAQPKPSIVKGEETDEEKVSVILAVLQAANLDVPEGGRVRIEKISSRS